MTQMRDVGRFHRLAWGGGQITIPKDFPINWNNKTKLYLEFDTETEEIKISELNKGK